MPLKRKYIGGKGEVEVIEIFAAVSNTELNDGSGDKIDLTYHPTKQEARTAAIGVGVMGCNGDVEPRLAVRFKDGTILLLAQREEIPWNHRIPAENAPLVKFSKPRPDQVHRSRRVSVGPF
jgi:hypothetical protein